MKDTAKARPATNGQLLEIGNTISGKVVKLLAERGFGFDQAKFLIESVGKTKIADFTEQLAETIFELAPADSTAHYKKDLETFFLRVYGLTLDLSELSFPKAEGFVHYMVNPIQLDCDEIYAGFKKLCIPSSLNYADEKIVQKKKTEQNRPATLYAFAHRGSAEPDIEHLDKSYDDFIAEGNPYMTINEYMLVFQFMYWKFKTCLDEKGWTRTSTLDSDGDVMNGCWDGQDGHGFKLSYADRDGCHYEDGPRSAVLS